MKTNLAKLRSKFNLTTRELSAQLPNGTISHSQITRVEKELAKLTFDQIVQLSIFFGVSADYLLGLSDNLVPRKINYYQEIPNQQKLTLEQVLSRFTNNEVMIVYTDDLITIIEEPHKLNRKIFKFEKIK